MFQIYLTQNSGKFLGPIAYVLGLILSYVYRFLAHFGIENAAVSIIVFTFCINLLLLPITIKQQKYSKMSSRMQPEIRKIQEKYKGKKDQESLMAQQEEMKALYEKYGTSPTGGCLPAFITMFVFLALYRVIYAIPAYVPQIKDVYDAVANVTANHADAMQYLADNAKSLRVSTGSWGDDLLAAMQGNHNYIIDVFTRFGRSNWNDIYQYFSGSELVEIKSNAAKIQHINYVLGGLNISESPMTRPWPGLIIPIISVILQYVQTNLMMANNPVATDPDNPSAAMMNSMNKTMPLMSGFFSLMFPIGAGIYLVTNSAFRILQQLIVNKQLEKMDLDAEIEKNIEKAQKKRARMHVEAFDGSVKNIANIRTNAVDIAKDTSANENEADDKDEKTYEKGSISYIAHMKVQNKEKK